tara:strand:+ start:724 stop:1215 length:492 start_codon:yes stop_codon:yes gene_type:complete
LPTFDIVSKYEIYEVENAVNMVKRDILNRYDFKGTNTSINLDKKKSIIVVESDSEMQIRTIQDMLEKRAVGRNIQLKTFIFNAVEKAGGMSHRQEINLQEGISKENSKKINKIIKDAKLKIQSQIQGEQLRVSGKKIDDLQSVIRLLKDVNIGIPLQFINMKK